jgi:hypothetical protein
MSRESDEVGEEQFWDQFRYDPDYPSTVKVEDYRQTDLWKEFEHGI